MVSLMTRSRYSSLRQGNDLSHSLTHRLRSICDRSRAVARRRVPWQVLGDDLALAAGAAGDAEHEVELSEDALLHVREDGEHLEGEAHLGHGRLERRGDEGLALVDDLALR